jgi:hypothetical protein
VRLPLGVRTVRLVSRIWVPARVLADSDDARSLGVAIGNVRLDGQGIGLHGPAFASGWLAPEAGWRWTGGDGALALAGARELAFEVVMTGSYREERRRVERVRAG